MPHVVNVQRTLAQQYEAIRASGAVARGMMADEVFRRRFNLSLADVQLMKPVVSGHSGSSSPQVLATHGFVILQAPAGLVQDLVPRAWGPSPGLGRRELARLRDRVSLTGRMAELLEIVVRSRAILFFRALEGQYVFHDCREQISSGA